MTQVSLVQIIVDVVAQILILLSIRLYILYSFEKWKFVKKSFGFWYFADPEEGVGNSHAAMGKLPVPTEVPGEEAKSPTAEDVQLPMGEGEKSVLQAKLTNLAIQIGYAGK